jgi:phospholipid/cholesterol/gamma-HCH transport system substrate-binding protein
MARRRYELGVGLLLAVALGITGYMAVRVGAIRFVGDQVLVTTTVADAAGLTEGAVVSIAGVDVGAVDAMRLVDGQASLTLAVDPEASVRKDAVARIRARSVLGEKYIELLPGQGALAESGDVLASEGGSYDIDQLVRALEPVITAIEPELVAEVMASLGAALREDPERVARMFERADVLLGNVTVASEDLPATMREARAPLGPARVAADDAQRAIKTAEVVLDRVDRVVIEAEGVAPEVAADLAAAMKDVRTLSAALEDRTAEIDAIIGNLSEIDRWELRRLLREEGIKVRLKEDEVVEGVLPFDGVAGDDPRR